MKHFKFIFIFFLFISFFTEAQTPERFINHRVGKGESLITIIEKYAISESQLLEYNPLVGRVGVKRRMTLRIPVYAFEVKQAEKAASNTGQPPSLVLYTW